MIAVKEKEPVGALPRENPARSGEGARGLPVEEIWQLITGMGALEPPQSHRFLVGPVLTWLRKSLWRILGVKPAHQQLVSLLSEILGSRFVLRDDTLDRAIFLNIVAENEYRLPNSFAADDIVIDIGMHIGSFCFAALLRGCAHVYGFEAERENYNLAVRNLQGFGERVHLYHKAVWRSDRTGDALYSGNGYVQGNTGGGCILYETQGEKLDLIAFDDIIRKVTNHGRKRIRLVKIDCEGSEFPILMTSRLLHSIDNIHGEYHHGVVAPAARVDGVAELTIEALSKHLRAAGFRVKSYRTPNSSLGLFFANRG